MSGIGPKDLYDLRGLFDEVAPWLLPWELREFKALVASTVARLDPEVGAANGGQP
jgi:hypothetical protein